MRGNRGSVDGFAASVGDDNRQVGENHCSAESDPTKWRGEKNGENEARSSYQHRDEITTLSSGLIEGEAYLCLGNGDGGAGSLHFFALQPHVSTLGAFNPWGISNLPRIEGVISPDTRW